MGSSQLVHPAGRTVVSLVGDFQVCHDGAVVRVPPVAQLLLCFLAIQEQPVRRPFVTGNLWPEADEQRASARLRSTLWRVPLLGGRPLVCTTVSHIGLDPGVAVDLHGVAGEIDRVFGPRASRLDSTALDRALELFGHDLLDGWYEDWAVLERERFRQVRLHVLDRLTSHLLAADRCAEALRVALTVVASDPLRESARRLMVRTHLREGNVAEAFRLYRAYADQLCREVGAAPSPAMTALLEPYRCHATALGASSS